MVFYIIRHKSTGLIMPQMKRGRGYSHWNPSISTKMIQQATTIPRILESEKQAQRCIVQWTYCPNAKNSIISSGPFGDVDDIIDIKPDGRKKEDLEVVKVILSINRTK